MENGNWKMGFLIHFKITQKVGDGPSSDFIFSPLQGSMSIFPPIFWNQGSIFPPIFLDFVFRVPYFPHFCIALSDLT